MPYRPSLRTTLAAACATICMLHSTPVHAGMELSDLDPEDRAVLHDILVEVLADMPDLLADPRLDPGMSERMPDPYAEAVAEDLAKIASHGEALFAPTLPGFGMPSAQQVVALFVQDGCTDCARAEADLRALALSHELRVTLIDLDRNGALAESLGLDTAPSYVFPDMMLRGHIPPIVLERYLTQ